ncbi:MAG: putative rane protein [Acidimicrobiales bacterium]|nr:putative rane protein [Acidimicrobiales bacterium]
MTKPSQVLTRRVPPALIATVGGASAAYLAGVDPAHGGHYPVCPFRVMTGLSCPLCGGLRATHQLLTGHPARAFEFNALYVAVLPFAVYALAAQVLASRGRSLPMIRVTPRVTWALGAVAVVFGVVRNLPGFHAWSALG